MNTEELIEAIGKAKARDEVVAPYVAAIRARGIDWNAANALIIKGWSAAALKYIKGRAWKIVGA